jgi:hypothetical protein
LFSPGLYIRTCTYSGCGCTRHCMNWCFMTLNMCVALYISSPCNVKLSAKGSSCLLSWVERCTILLSLSSNADAPWDHWNSIKIGIWWRFVIHVGTSSNVPLQLQVDASYCCTAT